MADSRCKTVIKKLKIALYRLTVWYAIALLSLATMFLIAHVPYPQFMSSYIYGGTEFVKNTAEFVKNITDSTPVWNGTEIVEYKEPSILEKVLITSAVIFVMNLKVLLLILTPFIGPGVYAFVVVYNAWIGRTVSEIVAGPEWSRSLFSLLFLSPHSHLEFLSYAIALYTSYTLGRKIVDTKSGSQSFRQYIVYALISIVCLYIASIVEACVFYCW